MHSVVMNIKRLIVLSTSLSLGLFGCSSLENLSGAEQLALSQFDDRPVLRISNYNSINGNRYIKVVEVNGEEFGSKSGYLPLDFGRNYIKVECGRNNSSVIEYVYFSVSMTGLGTSAGSQAEGNMHARASEVTPKTS